MMAKLGDTFYVTMAKVDEVVFETKAVAEEKIFGGVFPDHSFVR